MVDENGQALGIMLVSEALAIADSKDLDLVEVAAAASPPVCRLMDYGRFLYARKKKAQESRRKAQETKKKASAVILKDVKLGSLSGAHDVKFKVGHIRRFLEKGQRVRVSVFFRGRQITHPELGRRMLRRIFEMVEDIGSIESEPRLEGRNMTMLLTPK